MPIQVAQALIPSTVNTPIDARTVVNGTADIASIELPYIGMRVYCTGNGKEYRITSLKAKTIGALTVENAAVDEYEEITDGGSASSGGSAVLPTYSGSAVSAFAAGSNTTLQITSGGTMVITGQDTLPTVSGSAISAIAAGSNTTLQVTSGGTLTITAQGGGGGGVTEAQAKRMALIFG